ncbi:MAG: guanylate kinase [Dehalococcoidia bacterium]
MSSGASRSSANDGGPLLVVISGPSGAGKDSVLARLRERKLPFHFTVTGTTRPKREVNPADHEFLRFFSDHEFDRLLAEGGLLEHANVYGYRYGVPKAPVQEALERGQDVIMRVDIQGADSIKRLAPGALLVFLKPSSLEELEQRLRERRQDGEEALRRRLEAATRELDAQSRFDYVVVNEQDKLDEAVNRILEIIETERARPGRERVNL